MFMRHQRERGRKAPFSLIPTSDPLQSRDCVKGGRSTLAFTDVVYPCALELSAMFSVTIVPIDSDCILDEWLQFF